MSKRTDPCPVCDEPLNKSRTPSSNDQWVSCPNGSANYGQHVYLPPFIKGFTKLRSTNPKPDGSHSWCVLCRGKNDKNNAPCINNNKKRTCSSFE